MREYTVHDSELRSHDSSITCPNHDTGIICSITATDGAELRRLQEPAASPACAHICISHELYHLLKSSTRSSEYESRSLENGGYKGSSR